VTSKVFAEGNRRAAVRTHSGKYIKEPDRRELYDLSHDRNEQQNLVDRETRAVTAFSDVLRLHVNAEEERRAVEHAATDLIGEKKL
jgi:hypothetical protein